MRFFVFAFITLCLLACHKPNPTPELADDIYLDLNSRSQSVQKELEAEKKKFDGYKKELDTITPQTGAIKFAQKRYFESEARIQKLEQKIKYFELKTKTRQKYTRLEYMKAFQDGKPWPNQEEVEAYKKYSEVSNISPGWNTKNRVDSYEKEFGTTPGATKSTEKTKKAAKSESNGE